MCYYFRNKSNIINNWKYSRSLWFALATRTFLYAKWRYLLNSKLWVHRFGAEYSQILILIAHSLTLGKRYLDRRLICKQGNITMINVSNRSVLLHTVSFPFRCLILLPASVFIVSIGWARRGFGEIGDVSAYFQFCESMKYRILVRCDCVRVHILLPSIIFETRILSSDNKNGTFLITYAKFPRPDI